MADTCYMGHELTPENTARAGKYRQCKICRREAARRRAALHPGAKVKPVREDVSTTEVNPEGAEFQEIGAKLGISPQRANQLYDRAIAKLRAGGAAVLSEFLHRDASNLYRKPYVRVGGGSVEEWDDALGPAAWRLRHAEAYPDWHPDTSRAVSGPIGKATFPGRRFQSRKEARAYWLERAGRIVVEHKVRGRYIFRIPRETQLKEGA
jgi:hypothetical protein